MENNIERETILEEPTTPERPSEAPISDENLKNEQSHAESDEVEKVSDEDNEVEPEAGVNSEPEKATDVSNIIEEVPAEISKIEEVSNVIAVLSKKTIDNLKNPTSFVLHGGYYDCQYDTDERKFRQQAVLYVYAANGYGEIIGNYWFYAYDFDEDEWKFWGTCASLDLDSDDDDYLISVFCKGNMEKEETTVLSKSQISNINTMFQNKTLDNVDLIDVNALDTKKLVELRSH